ncbi:hypothetical protein FB451DRAFT_1196097 [Mycena latifolia]|nr:hypothetical protein FB451DRAFT_1196097 [Mycena latifolia]
MSSAAAAPAAATAGSTAAPFVYNWNTMSHRLLPVPPPSHEGFPHAQPLPLHRLNFNPLGVFDLRRRIGVFTNDLSTWNSYARRWRVSDIAWLASGASEDGRHHPGPGEGFFPELKALRSSLPPTDAGYDARRAFGEDVRKLIHDLATMWDRTFGSTTMILHSEGTTVPGTPARPEYLRCSAYLPPAFLRSNPNVHEPIAGLVQSFIEVVGVPTVEQWTANARLEGWKLTQKGATVKPNRLPATGISIPAPLTGGTAHYVFRGRPAPDLFPSPPVTAAANAPSPSQYGSDDMSDLSPDAMALLTAIERIGALETEVKSLRAQSSTLDAKYDNSQTLINDMMLSDAELSSQLSEALEREKDYVEQQNELHAFIAELQAQLNAAQRFNGSISSTPASTSPFQARPPSYTVSQPRTPTHLAPSRSVSPLKSSQEVSLPTTAAFLVDHQLGRHASALQTMVRHVSSAKWYEELGILGLDAELTSALLDCLMNDLQ